MGQIWDSSGSTALTSSVLMTLDILEPVLLLNSLSFSSMVFWAITLGGTSRESGGGCLTVTMEDVAVCLALSDLLLQGLEVVVVVLVQLGGGMEELTGP